MSLATAARLLDGAGDLVGRRVDGCVVSRRSLEAFVPGGDLRLDEDRTQGASPLESRTGAIEWPELGP